MVSTSHEPAPPPPPLLIIGCGHVGRTLLRRAISQGRRVIATTRDPQRLDALRAAGAEPWLMSAPGVLPDGPFDAIVTYPPDPDTDAAVADHLREHARRSVYISSTGVYGRRGGLVDDTTATDPDDPRAARRLAAERRFRDAGAVVLRAPGIYGPESGLHLRLRAGRYRIVGDGSRHVSRIHVQDLAALCEAALQRGAPGAAHVVGDLLPTPQREPVDWLCERLNLPTPPSTPLDQAHATLRNDRRVDPRGALSELGVSLRHPTYREGYGAILDS
ncbi:MAG: NAD(P)-binding domain-containing protein [Myxococcales bacterium]|jgi:hypothetical protein